MEKSYSKQTQICNIWDCYKTYKNGYHCKFCSYNPEYMNSFKKYIELELLSKNIKAHRKNTTKHYLSILLVAMSLLILLAIVYIKVYTFH